MHGKSCYDNKGNNSSEYIPSCITHIKSGVTFQLLDRIGVAMVSMFASTSIKRYFEPRSNLTKDFIIGICCFSVWHTILKKTWLALRWLCKDNMSEWSGMSSRGRVLQWSIKIQLSNVVWWKSVIILISSKCNLFSPWYSWQISHLVFNNNRPLIKI